MVISSHFCFIILNMSDFITSCELFSEKKLFAIFQETRGFLNRRTVNIRESMPDDMPDLESDSDDEFYAEVKDQSLFVSTGEQV